MKLKNKSMSRKIILFVPISWLLGLNLVYFHIISFLQYLVTKNKRSQDAIQISVLILISIYIISLFVNSFGLYEISLKRYFGSVYNLSFWIMGYFVYTHYKNTYMSKEKLILLSRSFVFIIFFMTFTFLLGYMIKGGYNLILNSILANFINLNGMPDIITNSLKLNIYGENFTNNGMTIRTSVLAPYSTISGATIVLITPYLWTTRYKRGSINNLILFVCIIILIIMSKSRGVYLAFCIYASLNIYFSIKSYISTKLLLLGFGIILSILFYINFIDFITIILNYRNDSTNLRFLLYIETLRLLVENNALIGLSVKPLSTNFAVPLGSHSTYFGLLLRIGILGTLPFLFIQKIIFNKLGTIRTNTRTLNSQLIYSLVAISFFLFFEDLDVPQFFCYLYFLNLGLINNENI